MKILSSKQIRQVDELTINNKPISSVDLMEQASIAFTEWFVSHFSPKCQVVVVCGTGNNGGDGLAISRLLLEKSYDVQVYVVKRSGSASYDFQVNEKRLKGKMNMVAIEDSSDVPSFKELNKDHIIIDAIFGSGLSRPVEGLYAEVIEAINEDPSVTVSVDICSGLFSDQPTSDGAIVEADHTVSFQIPKLAFFLPENGRYVGEWHLVDIGLLPEAMDNQESSNIMLNKHDLKPLIKKRNKFSHKGTHGRALLVAGSYGKMGAAVLSSKAALRSGVGLLSVHAPKCGYEILQTSVPEAMVDVDDHLEHIVTCYDIQAFDVIGIGPGLGKHEDTVNCLSQILQTYDKPMVIDADALNIISESRELLQVLPEHSILTPHPKEFERLAGGWDNDFQRLQKQKEFSSEYNVIVVLKGAHTSISLPRGRLYFNTSGNAGMATGGMGDALTGVIMALIAQGYDPEEAVRLGVYTHGLAGDLSAEIIGAIGFTTSDLIDFLPNAFQEMS